MPTAVRALLAAALVTAAAVGGGVALNGPAEVEAPPVAVVESTPLADLDTTALAANRAGFCPAIGSEQVTEALGGAAAAEASYDNGDRVELSAGVADVAHEFGCSWTGADGTEARGWVFAPPVTAERARRLGRAATRVAGCEPLPGAAEFGTPSTGVVCTGKGIRTVSYRGLFGDAWLACSLAAPVASAGTDLAQRADRWCAAVVLASTSDTLAG